MANITRRTPWRSPLLSPFDRDFSMRRMFDTMLGDESEIVGLTPAVEITENDKEFTCVAELPGIKQDDVNVSFDDGVLTIRGEKRDSRDSKEGNRYHMLERSYGRFERSFTFPSDVDPDQITADFEDGVLTVHLKKTASEKRGAKRIPIGGGKH